MIHRAAIEVVQRSDFLSTQPPGVEESQREECSPSPQGLLSDFNEAERERVKYLCELVAVEFRIKFHDL
jgi:hypothetical protein